MSGVMSGERRAAAVRRRGARTRQGMPWAGLPGNSEIGLQAGLLRSITERIVREFSPRRVVLFGSRARGDAREDSDIDLFVEMESSLDFYKRTAQVLALFGARPWAMDLLVYTPQEVERDRGMVGLIVDEVETEGIALYERGREDSSQKPGVRRNSRGAEQPGLSQSREERGGGQGRRAGFRCEVPGGRIFLTQETRGERKRGERRVISW